VLHVLPVAQRPEHYSPLEEKHLDKEWIRRLGQSGKDCYAAILAKDAQALGASLNECMKCWEMILPHTVRHPTVTVDLAGILGYYQSRYAGAMYSGCGGGYLYVVSDEPVPGGIRVKVRYSKKNG
jgi:ribosomal protein L32